MTDNYINDKAYLVQSAQEYVQKGKIDKAIAQWSKLLNVNQDGQIYNTIGDLYIKKGSHDEAVEFFTKAASIFKKHGFYSKATGIYNKILTVEPDNLDIVVSLSRLNAERGFPGKAVEDFINASEKLTDEGEEEKALLMLEKALSIFPNDIDIEKQIKEVTSTIDINAKIKKSDESQGKLFQWIRVWKSKKVTAKAEKHRRRPLSLLIRGAVFLFVVAAVLTITFESSYRDSEIVMPGPGPSTVEDIDEDSLTEPRQDDSSVSETLMEPPLLPRVKNDIEISNETQAKEIDESETAALSVANETPEEEINKSETAALPVVSAEPEAGVLEFDPPPFLIHSKPLKTMTLGEDIMIKGLGEDTFLNNEIENDPDVVSEEHIVEEKIVEESAVEESEEISITDPALMATYTSAPSVVYDEQFNNNKNNWSIFDTLMATALIDEGKYYINNKREFGRHIVLFNYFFSHKLDFSLEAAVNKENGPDNSAYGLVFAVKNSRNNHVFQIIGYDKYSIGRYVNGDFQEITGGKIGEKVIKRDSANVLKLAKQGNDIHFLINNHYLDRVSGLALYGKKTGFILDGKTTISIDYTLLQVWNNKKTAVSKYERLEDSVEESPGAVPLSVPTKRHKVKAAEAKQDSYFNRSVKEIQRSPEERLRAVPLSEPLKRDKRKGAEAEQGSYYNRGVQEIRKSENAASDKSGRAIIVR